MFTFALAQTFNVQKVWKFNVLWLQQTYPQIHVVCIMLPKQAASHAAFYSVFPALQGKKNTTTNMVLPTIFRVGNATDPLYTVGKVIASLHAHQ